MCRTTGSRVSRADCTGRADATSGNFPLALDVLSEGFALDFSLPLHDHYATARSRVSNNGNICANGAGDFVRRRVQLV